MVVLGQSLGDCGDRAEAIHAYRQAIELRERQVAEEADPAVRDRLVRDCYQVENACLNLGDTQAADEVLARARVWADKSGFSARLPVSFVFLLAESARVKLLVGDRESAKALAREGMEKQVSAADRSLSGRSGPVLTDTYELFGRTLAKLDEREPAREAYRRNRGGEDDSGR